jgi:hypothetical protein
VQSIYLLNDAPRRVVATDEKMRRSVLRWVVCEFLNPCSPGLQVAPWFGVHELEHLVGSFNVLAHADHRTAIESPDVRAVVELASCSRRDLLRRPLSRKRAT